MDTTKLPLHEKIKELRNEKGWTQTELAEKIGSDARMISQYEKGKSVPSVDYIVKFSQIFDVTTDYFLVENAPRISLKNEAGKDLIESLNGLEKLNPKDKESIMHIIKSLIAQNKVKDILNKAAS